MNDAELAEALVWALTGQRSEGGGGDVHALLVEAGWDRAAIASHARAVTAGGGVWPHPVPDDLRLRVGSARLLAAVQQAQVRLELFGDQSAPAQPRALNADERRLMQDVPPHHGS